MINDSEYELLDEYPEHDDCIRIPYPKTGYGWVQIYYEPARKRFFYEEYSTGAIADDETRYHGSEYVSVEEVKRMVPCKWPLNKRGVEVLNEILARDFPGESPVEEE